jgi:D-threo-aldose 1-dehydrogenase
VIRRKGSALRTGDLALPALGYGGGSLFGIEREREAADLLTYAYGRGFSYFDTAPFYASGLGEHWYGTALRIQPRESFLLSTKVGRRLRPDRSLALSKDRLPFEVFYDYSYDGVMRSLEDSLQRLGLASVDIVYLHDVNPRWHGKAYEERFREAMEGAYPALERLRSEGVVRAIGVGLKGGDICLRFARAGNFDCVMLAGGYTLLEHDSVNDLLPYCAAHDIAVVVASPFNSGILAKGPVEGATFFYASAPADVIERTRRIEAICQRHGVPLGAAALQFTLSHPAVVSAVCGYRSREEVDTNLRWSTLPIPGALWEELDAAALIPASAAAVARGQAG